jgi:hypothetical protein
MNCGVKDLPEVVPHRVPADALRAPNPVATCQFVVSANAVILAIAARR